MHIIKNIPIILRKPLTVLRRSKRARRKAIATILVLLITASGFQLYFFLNPPAAEAAWFNDSWGYRKKLVIDETKVSGSTDLTDFPVLVKRDDDTDLRDHAQSDGDDILFTDVNGAKLDHEIENYNSSDADLVAWVHIPTLLAAEDSVIYMYYGNPSASNQENIEGVWDKNYSAVWHLNESSGTRYDSTDNSNDLSENGTGGVGQDSTGQIGSAADFERGDSDFLSITDALQTGLDLANSDYTMEFWVNFETSPYEDHGFIEKYDSVHDEGDLYYIRGAWNGSDNRLHAGHIDGWVLDDEYSSFGATGSSTGTWYYHTIIFDDSDDEIIFCRDGSCDSADTMSETSDGSGNDFRLGYSDYAVDYYLDGQLDEVRISSTERSGDWVTTGYNTMNSPSTFFKSVGSEEVGPGPLAWWKLDEGYGTTAQDSTSHNYDGTLNNTPTWQTEDLCISGKCLYFDGASDESIQTSSTVAIPDAYTLSTWVRGKKSNQIAENIYILGWDNKISLTLQNSSQTSRGGILIRNAADTSYYEVWNGEDLLDNRWHQLAATVDTSSLAVKIYIDGKLNYSTSISDHYSGSQKLNVAAWLTTYGNFTGHLDEPKIYPYVRSADEIKTDFQHRLGLHGSSSVLGSRDYSYLSDGLVGYWKMDESSADSCSGGEDSCDSSGNGYHGTWVDNATSAAGKFGNGVTFDDSNDYVNSGDINELDGASIFTFSFWANITSFGAWDGFIYKGVDSNNQINIQQGSSSGEIYALIRNDNSSHGYGSGLYNTGEWFHTTIVYNGNGSTNADRLKMFVNGVGVSLTFSGTIPSQTDDNSGSFLMGSNLYGLMDEVRLYNRALTPSEVADLYKWAPGPVGYWNFDEGTGTSTVYDRSGNGNNGTMSGSMTESDWVPGKFGSALDFDGNNDRVIVGDISSKLNLQSTDPPSFTFSGWMKAESGIPNYGGMKLMTGDGSGFARFLFSTGGYCTTAPCFLFQLKSSSTISAMPTAVSYDTWYYVTAVYNQSNHTQYLYVNGVLQDSDVAADYDLSAAPMNLTLGYSQWYFKGGIDDVRVYDYVRTQEQIIEDMNAGHPAPGSPIGSPVLHYKFDEGYGDTANDSSVQGNDGDLAGSGGSCPGAAACPTWTNSGKFDKALDFDKTNDYVFVTNGFTNTIKGDDTHTVSVWIYPRTVSGDTTVISLDDGSSYGFYIVLKTGGYYISYGGSWRTYTSTYSLYEWQHLAVVKNGTGNNMTLYLNGVEQSSYTGSVSSIPNTNDDYLIGKSPGGYIFDGYIDEVKIYNFSLTAEQIKLDFNKGSTASFGNIADQNDEGFGGDPPVGWWKLDENTDNTCDATNDVCDTTGNNYHGAKTNMDEADWVPGKIGSALDFDGSNDRVNMGDVLDLTGSSGITLSAWIYARTINSWDSIIDKLGGSGNYRFMLMSNGTVELGIRDTASGYESVTTDNGTINTGQWYHVAATFDDNTTGKIYINGVLNKTKTDFTLTRGDTGTVLGLGYASNNGQYFDGLIDDARIYDYVRSPAQIAYDYNRGGPVSHWKLDECQGTTAYDSGSGGNNGTITIGGSGSNTTPGTCSSGTGTEAWNNGTTGKRNYSLDFDGNDDYVEAGNPASLQLTSTGTIAAWIKWTSGSYGSPAIVCKSNWTTDRNGYCLAGYDDGIDGELANASAQLRISSTNDYKDSQWHHAVFTWDGTWMNLYVDGIPAASPVSQSFDPVSNVYNLTFGKDPASSNYDYDGQIDDVRIYNYALTADQVKRVYNNGAVFFGPSEGSP